MLVRYMLYWLYVILVICYNGYVILVNIQLNNRSIIVKHIIIILLVLRESITNVNNSKQHFHQPVFYSY